MHDLWRTHKTSRAKQPSPEAAEKLADEQLRKTHEAFLATTRALAHAANAESEEEMKRHVEQAQQHAEECATLEAQCAESCLAFAQSEPIKATSCIIAANGYRTAAVHTLAAWEDLFGKREKERNE